MPAVLSYYKSLSNYHYKHFKGIIKTRTKLVAN